MHAKSQIPTPASVRPELVLVSSETPDQETLPVLPDYPDFETPQGDASGPKETEHRVGLNNGMIIIG